MSTGRDFEIELDFTRVQNSAERVRTMLHKLRRRFDLTPLEFCKEVRIAPTEIPHSHPRIILYRQAAIAAPQHEVGGGNGPRIRA